VDSFILYFIVSILATISLSHSCYGQLQGMQVTNGVFCGHPPHLFFISKTGQYTDISQMLQSDG
jgi:hypothetical protein